MNDCPYFYRTMKKQLIVIEGPTASGKTGVSVALAKQLKTVILSADSRQFYKEIAIGTAKPSLEEQNGVKHYFIDSHTLKDEVSSAQFEKEALFILEKEFQQHDRIILTGGSGMFIDALCIGLDKIPSSKELREKIQQEYEENGLLPLTNELKKKDPEYYETVDLQNPMRIIRAIEAIRLSNEKYSDLRKRKPSPRPFDVIRFVLQHPREKLYQRINERVDIMLEKGLIAEAQNVQHMRKLSSLNTVGYKELFDYFDGNISLNQAVDSIKQNSRRYAKRQLTWFKRHKESTWIEYSTQEKVVEEILNKVLNN